MAEFPEINGQMPQAQQPMQPQPIPTQIGFGKAQMGPMEFVVLQFTTAQGTNVFFLDERTAKVMQEGLNQMLSPIQIVPASALPPRPKQ